MPATFDNIPAEIKYMILELLEPDEIGQLHSTSRSWRAASDEHYRVAYWEDLYIYVDKQGIDRMEEISRSEYRECVKEINFWYDEHNDTDSSGSTTTRESLDEPDDYPREHAEESAITAAAATAAVRRAMEGFTSCTCISLDDWFNGITFNRINLMYNTEESFTERPISTRLFEEYLVLCVALTAATASTRVNELHVPMECNIAYTDLIDFATEHHLDVSHVAGLERIEKVEVLNSYGVPFERVGTEMPSLMSLCTSVKVLELDFRNAQAETDCDTFVDFLRLPMEGLQRLTIESVRFDPEQLFYLVQSPRARSIKKIELIEVDMYTRFFQLHYWVEVIRSICRNLELESLLLLRCTTDQKEMKHFDRRELPTTDDDGLKYFDLKDSTMDRVVGEFIADIREWDGKRLQPDGFNTDGPMH